MSLQQSSVLVVDDELSLCKVLRISLAGSGFAVEEARNGEEVNQGLENEDHDVRLAALERAAELAKEQR